MNKENNRRAMLTKKILENKLIELLKEKRIEQISISKLCENAGINRSTFYKHYMNQYDLLNNIEKKVLDKMIDYLDMFIENNNTKTLELMLIYIQENKNIFYVLLCSDYHLHFQKKFIEIAITPIKSKLSDFFDMHPSEYIYNYVIMGSFSVIGNWIINDFDISCEKLSHLIFDLCLNSLSLNYLIE